MRVFPSLEKAASLCSARLNTFQLQLFSLYLLLDHVHSFSFNLARTGVSPDYFLKSHPLVGLIAELVNIRN